MSFYLSSWSLPISVGVSDTFLALANRGRFPARGPVILFQSSFPKILHASLEAFCLGRFWPNWTSIIPAFSRHSINQFLIVSPTRRCVSIDSDFGPLSSKPSLLFRFGRSDGFESDFGCLSLLAPAKTTGLPSEPQMTVGIARRCWTVTHYSPSGCLEAIQPPLPQFKENTTMRQRSAREKCTPLCKAQASPERFEQRFTSRIAAMKAISLCGSSLSPV